MAFTNNLIIHTTEDPKVSYNDFGKRFKLFNRVKKKIN